MAVPSAQDIQEQIRQQQLIGVCASPQHQSFHPMAAGGNYAPFVPQAPLQLASAQPNVGARGTPVSMGKLSLLAISFSLMLLGAFTFLGGFLLGIWVAGPKISQSMGGYLPPQQNPYYPTGVASPHRGTAQPHSGFSQNLGSSMGSAMESTVSEAYIPGAPRALSPLIRAAQSQVAGYAGEKTEGLFEQQSGAPQPQPYSQQQFSPPLTPPAENYSPQPSEVPTQLPVITPQSGNTSGLSPTSYVPDSQEKDGGYTVQLGVYALHENAEALVNHMQILGYPAQITEGKSPDGSKTYHVHSGFYKNYTTAVHAASQFASQNIPGAIIVKISQHQKSAL